MRTHLKVNRQIEYWQIKICT